jgi:hypothetical protein
MLSTGDMLRDAALRSSQQPAFSQLAIHGVPNWSITMPKRLMSLHVRIGNWTPERPDLECAGFLETYHDLFPRPFPADV